MRQLLARLEQTEPTIQIVKSALRAAAPAYRNANDVTSGILRLPAELARAEVSRA
jgi:hypothetical protein